MNPFAADLERDGRTSAGATSLAGNESMFRQLFERSADAIFLFEPGREIFVDCNGAAVEMMRATSKQQLLMAEADLHRTLAGEKELSQLKSNFVSMVSHEFRTPLGIIQSSAELLRDFHEKMPPAERQEQLQSIFGNTRWMAGMMEEAISATARQ